MLLECLSRNHDPVHPPQLRLLNAATCSALGRRPHLSSTPGLPTTLPPSLHDRPCKQLAEVCNLPCPWRVRWHMPRAWPWPHLCSQPHEVACHVKCRKGASLQHFTSELAQRLHHHLMALFCGDVQSSLLIPDMFALVGKRLDQRLLHRLMPISCSDV